MVFGTSQEATPQNLGGAFGSPEEEIAFLRAQIESIESTENRETRERAIKEEVVAYQRAPVEQVLAPEYALKAREIETSVLKMGKDHEEAINELLRVTMERGIKNTLTILEKLNDSHLQDDFHRFLVQFLAEGKTSDFLMKEKVLFRALRMKLYEITLPPIDEKGQERGFSELVVAMEQVYAGMLSLENPNPAEARNHFTIELALSNFSSEIVFYAAVPREHAGLFEKQVLGVYADAKLREHKEDYNPFNGKGATVVSVAEASRDAVYPIKTYEAFPQDPLNVFLASFGKMKHEGEGVALQIVIMPRGTQFTDHYTHIRDEVKKGVSVKKALEGLSESFVRGFASTSKELLFGSKAKDDKLPQDEVIALFTEKIASPIVDTNIRIVASAETEARAREMQSEVEAVFHQFTRPEANSITWKRLEGADLLTGVRQFSFRLFDDAQSLPLNLKELTTLLHFPVSSLSSPELREAKAGVAPAPASLSSSEGIILGLNTYHGKETLVRMGREDRVRHMYVIGQTGTGKTSILKNMILQDIKNGDGVCFIDPHGSDVQDILSLIPPERMKDVIYFDPSHVEHPMGLNMLEYDERYPEQKTFVVNEMMNIFNQLFDMKAGGGPIFEQYFKNAAFLVMEDPSSGSTLLEITRVLSDKEFRAMKLARCKNPIIKQFWASAEQTTGEAGLQNMVPYISSKFDTFISNDIMRPIVLQQKSVFNFREIMDNRKILLVNLSKGRLGDINSSLIGLILVAKIQMAALSRVDTFGTGQTLPDFYLYIDEFQNVTTPSIASILSEARKYRLSLNVAHQYISQLSEEIKNAIFGNVGSIAVFRVGPEEAKFLENKLSPTFTAEDIMKLDNYNAYLNMLVNGQPAKPFNIATLPPEQGNKDQVEKLKELSYLTYGKPRAEVEAEIFGRFSA